MTEVKGPVALIILDGFGYSESDKYNAISAADAPTWQSVWQKSPSTTIATSGMSVGLPEGQMGNSEVGHMSLGAGRVVYQNFTRINKAITDGDFFENSVYCAAIDKAVSQNKAVHIMGLLSAGGVHSHENHIFAIMELAVKRGAKQLYLHAFLDGRDCPPRSAEPSIKRTEEKFKELGLGRIASVCGRFFALDRDNRWDRVQTAYDLMTAARSEYKASSALDALSDAYAREENDEFVKPTSITDAQGNGTSIADGDSVIFMNFRPDRARQITNAFVDDNFDGFTRNTRPALAEFVMTTEYAGSIDTPCAYPPIPVVNSFGEVLQNHKKTQLRIAETEKYAHVTFFFSGGQEAEYEGEERILIQSPDVETYDLLPEMSAFEVTDKLVEAIESGKYDAIICNYANCDQVGHTGDFDAAVKAVEAVDKCLAKVFAAIKKVGGEALITADHGNAEEMYDEVSGQPHTQHTTLPVPLVYIGNKQIELSNGGSLADIAPSMLDLLGIKQPREMTGRSLILNSEDQ